MRRSPLLLLPVLLVGGFAWWLGHAGGSAPDATEEEAVGGREASVPPPAGAPALASRGPQGARPVRAPKGTSAIVGTVRRAGQPVAAEVAVRWVGDPSQAGQGMRFMSRYYDRLLAPAFAASDPVATAKAGADGRFAVEGLGVGDYSVTAVATDGARGSVRATIPADGARVEANPAISGGKEVLRGRVVRADGRPWQGQVFVQSVAQGGGPDLLLQSPALEVDENGRFVAEGLEAGRVAVTAVVQGSLRVTSRPISVPYAGEYVFTVDANLVVVKGRVVADADGAPIAGASVVATAWGTDVFFAAASATTDEQGAFEVLAAPGMNTGILARAEGYAPAVRQRVGVKAGEPVEIRLARGATLAGRATRASDGQPVAGVTVRVVPVGDRADPMLVSPTDTVTDGNGHYEAKDLSAGEVMPLAEGAGYVTQGVKDVVDRGFNPLAVTLVAGQTTTADLLLVVGARAEGVVLDAEGKPLAGALVRAEPSGFMRGRAALGSTAPAATGPDGRFAMDSLVIGGGYVFSADAAGFPTARTSVMTATEAEPLHVEIRLPADRRVDVVVLEDAGGTPVAGAQVSGWVQVQSGAVTVPSAWTGPDGHARVGPLPPGDARLNVAADGYVQAQNLKVAEGDSSVTVRLARGLEVRGRVVTSGGAAVGGASVFWRPGDGQATMWSAPDTTGPDGTFRLRGVAAGSGTVQAWSRDPSDAMQGMQGTRGAKAGDTDVVVTVSPTDDAARGPTVTVRVVDGAGRPVPRAQASVASADSRSGSLVTDGKAQFRLGRDRKDAVVSVWGARGADGAPLPLGPGRAPLPADATEIEVRLPPEARIDGTVLGPDGQGVRGVLVQAMPSSSEDPQAGYNPWNAFATARTDARGAFRLGGLAAEDYRLSAQASADYGPTDPVVARGGSSGVEILLKTGVAVTVTVLDPQGKPVVGATVSAFRQGDARRGSAGAATDARGVARLAGLDPAGVYQLGVWGGREDLLRFDVAEWRPHDETVRLTGALKVSGVVRDQAGRPVAQAIVMGRDARGTGFGAMTEQDGTFSLGPLGEGPITLQVQVQGLSAPSSEAAGTVVAAGTTGVVLTVDVGLELVVHVENYSTEGGRLGMPLLEKQGGEPSKVALSPVGGAGAVLRFRGLEADAEYTLWIPPAGDLSLIRTGLRAGSEVSVRLVAGRPVSGRALLPSGVADASVSVSRGRFNVSTGVAQDGRFEVRGLPDGPWTVRVAAQSKDGRQGYAGEVETVAGATVDVAVKPR